jgi:hypothetical protein
MVPLRYISNRLANFGSIGAVPGEVSQIPDEKVKAFLESGQWQAADLPFQPEEPAAPRKRTRVKEGSENGG